MSLWETVPNFSAPGIVGAAMLERHHLYRYDEKGIGQKKWNTSMNSVLVKCRIFLKGAL